MARYKDVEGYRKLFDEEYKKTRELIFQGETHLDNLAEGFSEASRVIDRMPTVDVVPKSEVEELLTRLNDVYVAIDIAEDDVYRLEKENDELKDTNQHLFEFIAEVKREIAIEIFEEIEEALFNNHDLDLHSDYPTPHYYEELKYDIAELKKKYTEEQT